MDKSFKFMGFWGFGVEQKFDTTTKTVYAQEGELAHRLAELELLHATSQIDTKEYNRELKKVKKHKLYSKEMPNEVQKYVDFVMEEYSKLNVYSKPELFVEQKYSLSNHLGKGCSKIDGLIVNDNSATIMDLKYGIGEKVDSKDNPQLMLYALSVLEFYDLLQEIESFKLVIFQPRIDNVSWFCLSKEYLLDWAETELKPKVELAQYGKGEKVAGSWCKFCKVAPMCRALAQKNLELAEHDFKDPHLLSPEEVLTISKQIPMLTAWAKSVDRYILSEAISGKKWEGYKLVEGKSNRKWVDPLKVAEELSESHSLEEYTETKLLGIPAIEKLVGKKNFNDQYNHLVIKPQGSPTLVPESDPRPELNSLESAKQAFDDNFEG